MKKATTGYQKLTKDNAHLVSTIINKNNEDWGAKKFNYNEQPLNDGKFAHTVGTGSNSSVLFDSDFIYWSVVSFK